MNLIKTKNLRFNFTVNVIDGGFFGAALGFASFITIIPLFVSRLTDSAVLIGLIPAIHAVGWQLPQLFTAQRVSKLSEYKRMALLMSLNERVPFLGLAIVAWYSPQIGVKWSLILVFILLTWQGFGGGFTATAWQSSALWAFFRHPVLCCDILDGNRSNSCRNSLGCLLLPSGFHPLFPACQRYDGFIIHLPRPDERGKHFTGQ
jgi:MFS family permease